MMEGRKDVRAEFATSIDVEGATPQPDLTLTMPILRIRYVYNGLIYQLWLVDEF
jgi:hypothetical protein